MNAIEGFLNVRQFLLLIILVPGIGCARTRNVLVAGRSQLSPVVAVEKSTVKAPPDRSTQVASDASSQPADTQKLTSEQAVIIQTVARVGVVDPVEDLPREVEPTETESAGEDPAEEMIGGSGAEEPITPLFVPPSIDAGTSAALNLDQVIASVYAAYPSLEAAIHQRGIVLGELITAEGAFDTKLKAATENTSVGFYENYRNSIGLIQPIYQGGELFAGFRIGRGSFEPWYQERQTNGAGEFKAGVVLPLARNRTIDERRAGLWRTQYERQVVEADIQAQLITFVQQASIAYWTCIAAGESYRVADETLKLATSRADRIRDQAEGGFIDPPELKDNLRLIAERKAKLAQVSEKLQKASIKLSIYYRDQAGRPVIPGMETLPRFPKPTLISAEEMSQDAQLALSQRPELAIYDFVKRQLDVDYAQACNQLRPEVDAVFTASKDAGEPTSSKNDKGPFQLDASVFVDVPIQRRKAKGKIQSIESKVSQLYAKRRLTENKIVADVQSAYASLTTAFQQVAETQQAVEYAEELAERERDNQREGLSDMLKVTLREQYAVESRQKNIDALLDYFIAQANYRAALAQDRLPN